MSDLNALPARGHWLPVCIGAGTALALLTLAVSGLPAAAMVASSFGLAAWAALGAQRRSRAAEGRMEDALETSQALERANLELRRFAPTISHDLRAPLVSTAGFLEMARDKALAGEVVGALELLDRATVTTARMDEMISEFLRIALGQDPQEASTVDLDEVVLQSLDDLGPTLERHDFEVIQDSALGSVMAPRAQVQQVFDNLLGNAAKYGIPSSPGLRPRLCIQARPGAEGRLMVHIVDNGPGLGSAREEAASSLARGTSGAGLGLGLELVERAMETCGGSFSMESLAKGGTAVALDFQGAPCQTQPKAALPATSASSLSRTMQTTG